MDDTGCLLALAHEALDAPPPRPSEGALIDDDPRARDLSERDRLLLDAIQQPAFGISPQRGVRRKVVTILWDPHKQNTPDRADVDTMRSVMHGAVASVRDYFLEVSRGQFTIEDAGVLGWYEADFSPDEYWPGMGQFGRDSGAEAIRKAARDINFAAFDEDGDGELRPDELAVVFILPGTGDGGGLGRRVGADFLPRGAGQGVVVDGVRILHIVEVSIGSPPQPGIVAHELSHLLLNLGDMYFTDFNPVAAGPYSLMDQDGQAPHLDPVHKLKLGWLSPQLVTEPGSYPLPAISATGDVLVLASDDRGADEYFIVENRWPTGRYDERLPSRGIGVWHVIEDASTFDRFPPPMVSATSWQKVGGWPRQGIRMIRPRQRMPFSRTLPLWDGADRTGIRGSLVPQQRHDEHGTLRWADGSSSGFALTEIPAAGRDPSVTIDTNWAPETGIHAVTGLITSLSICDDDHYHHLGVDAVVRLDSRPRDSFGIPLRRDDDFEANAGMFAVLRSAAADGQPVQIEFDEDETALRQIIRVAKP